MRLIDAIRLEPPFCLALTGAGGKSSTMFQLGRELLETASGEEGKNKTAKAVILSATTHLAIDQIPLADIHIEIDENKPWLDSYLHDLKGLVLITGSLTEDGRRTVGLTQGLMDRVHETSKILGLTLLVEADGSRRLPLKAPYPHEPVIPDWVDAVVVAAGLSALGKPLTPEWVYNPEQFERLSGSTQGEAITARHLVEVLCHPDGGLKGIPLTARRIALLNQVNDPELLDASQELARRCLSGFESVVIVDLANHPRKFATLNPVKAVYEPVTAVILAAGRSRRMGQPKMVLPWGEVTIIQHIVERILDSGIEDVLVVSGGAHQEITRALAGKPVKVLFNPDFAENEMLDSFKLGLLNVSHPMQAALVVLGDQPQIQSRTIQEVLNAYAFGRPALVVPSFQKRRGHPWLVDRGLWPSILGLEPPQTLRRFLNDHQAEIRYIDSPDDTILQDLDTPDDYFREKETGFK
jgi:molybdenum cofactor cytidylyltransferase